MGSPAPIHPRGNRALLFPHVGRWQGKRAKRDKRAPVSIAANRATLPENAQSTFRKNSKRGTGATRAGAKAEVKVPSRTKGKARATKVKPSRILKVVPEKEKGMVK